MRRFAAVVAAASTVAACGQPPEPPPPAPPPTAAAPTGPIDPGRINRARYELPPDYEVAEISGRVAPLAQWGFGPGWTTEPARCGVLADPPLDPASVRGWSASGAGGIVYAVAAGGVPAVDPTVLGECGNWTMSAGPAAGTVRLTEAPSIDGVTTVGMAADSLIVVEGGTETRSHATTVVAYEQPHLVYVTVVTDPGLPGPPLDPGFAGDLLTKTVAALRS